MTSDAVWDLPAMTACAVALRPDWDDAAVTGGLAALRNDGRSPTWALAELCRIASVPDGAPRDLLPLVRRPAPVADWVPPPRELLDELRADLVSARETTHASEDS